MRLLQVCNVGNIVGGTAACAWTTVRALPEWEHLLWFRTRPTAATRRHFQGCQIKWGARLSSDQLRALGADVILLHNTPAAAVSWGSGLPIKLPSVVQYAHSAGRDLAGGHARLACSRYLASQLGWTEDEVLLQGVPIPEGSSQPDLRERADRWLIGRLCTPTARKWPAELIEFYRHLATRHPQVDWEFVGCPEALQPSLRRAILEVPTEETASGRERIRFLPAGWEARSRLLHWHALLYSQPSLPETFGRVCAEAMRCGCVPIVDRQGGFVEQVQAGTGWLCGSPEEFAERLGGLCKPGVWRELSGACRQLGDRLFSLQSYRTRLLRVFHRILSRI